MIFHKYSGFSHLSGGRCEFSGEKVKLDKKTKKHDCVIENQRKSVNSRWIINIEEWFYLDKNVD